MTPRDISAELDEWVLSRRRRGIDPTPLPPGVTAHKGRYQARAKVGGRTTYLGTWDTPAEAGAAVSAAAAAAAEPKKRPNRAPGKGVYRTHYGRFVGKFKRNGKTVLVGTFGSEEEAAAAVAERRGEVRRAQG